MSAMSKATIRALLIVGTLGGCYVYAPSPSNRPPGSGEEVRAVRPAAGPAARAPLRGDGVGFVDGRVQAVSDTALTMAVSETTTRAGSSAGWTGEKVVLRRDYVANFQEKVLSRPRSWGLGAVALAAAVASYAVFRGAATSSGGGTGGGGGHR